MKQVVNKAMVAHLWAHQSQDSARTSNGQFYFDGMNIYSYGTHFRCASVVKNKKEETAYLVTARTYSNTTSRHMSHVHSAIPLNKPMFITERLVKLKSGKLDKWNYPNALYYIIDQLVTINAHIAAQQKARLRDYSSPVMDCLINMGKWIKFWGLDKRQKASEGNFLSEAITILLSNKTDHIKHYWFLPEENACYYSSVSDKSSLQKLLQLIVDADLIKGVVDSDFQAGVLQLFQDWSGDNEMWLKFAERQQKQIEIKRNAEETQLKISRMSFEEKQLLWKQGSIKNIYVPYGYEFNAILRIHKNQVETSKGITLNFTEATRLWKLIHRFHKNEIEFQKDIVHDTRNNKWILNSYHDDILTAGCHTIAYREMEEVAEQLGLAA
jgi:hypothetical protein